MHLAGKITVAQHHFESTTENKLLRAVVDVQEECSPSQKRKESSNNYLFSFRTVLAMKERHTDAPDMRLGSLRSQVDSSKHVSSHLALECVFSSVHL